MQSLNKIIIVSGTSGSGKTTLVNYLLKKKELNLAFSISACSRQKRLNETHGENYVFFSKSEFKHRIDKKQFLEWEEVYPGQFYGTLKKSIDELLLSGKNILFDIDVHGALSIKKYFKNTARTIFVQPPSFDTVKQRLIKRQTESAASLEKRINKMKEEMLIGQRMDYCLLNDDLDVAKSSLFTYVKRFLES